MTKVRKNMEDAFEDIAYAESGEYNPQLERNDGTDSLEDIFSAIGMAEGGEVEYAKKLHALFHLKHSSN